MLQRKTPLKSNVPMRPISEKTLKARLADGDMRNSTFKKSGKPTRTAQFEPKLRNTSPKRSVLEMVLARSGGFCEWPICPAWATDTHHRLNRKAGGRHGEAHERINGAEWLLKACRKHHDYVTSAHGERLKEARDMGWVLREHQNAAHVPVLTRHHPEPVWLTPDGSWVKYEEASAR